jgi:phosphoglucosamine mutase
VVRASGTEPLIRIMAEGDDEKLVTQIVREIAGAVKKAAA